MFKRKWLKEYDAKDKGYYRTRWRERWWQYWRPVKPPKDKAKRLIKNRRQSRVFWKDEKE